MVPVVTCMCLNLRTRPSWHTTISLSRDRVSVHDSLLVNKAGCIFCRSAFVHIKKLHPGKSESDMPPNAFQVWQARTNLTAIPWCADRGCSDWFVNHALPNQSDITNTIVSRLRCSSDVFVPDYLVNSVGNLTSDDTYSDPDGELRFAHRVCTCSGAMMYGGEDCTPQGAGVIYAILLLATWIWILGLTVRAVYLLAGGTIKKRSKQVLVVLAIIQQLGQLGWFFDMNMTSLVTGHEDRVLVAGLCFVVSILCLFAFLCGMVLESILILEQQTRNISHLRTLRILKRFLAVVPLAVCGVAIWAMPFRDETTPVMAGAFGVLAIFIGTAFSVIISILDNRLRWYSTKAASVRPVIPVHSVVASGGVHSAENLTHAIPQTTNADTDAVSKRLRSLASSLRLVLLLNIVFSASLVSVVVMGGEQLAILELPCFVVWQISQACIPMVGVSGLAVHARERLAKRMPGVTGLHLHHHHHEHLETVNSSDCGTLTS
jgi:hypothetical protein